MFYFSSTVQNCMVQVESSKELPLDCHQCPLSEYYSSSQALNLGIMAVSYCLYFPVSDDIISFNPHFWFLEKFEPELNPYLVSGLNLGRRFLGPAEGILIALLHSSLCCFSQALFWDSSCPCPLDKTISDIFLCFSLSFSLSHKVTWWDGPNLVFLAPLCLSFYPLRSSLLIYDLLFWRGILPLV